MIRMTIQILHKTNLIQMCQRIRETIFLEEIQI